MNSVFVDTLGLGQVCLAVPHIHAVIDRALAAASNKQVTTAVDSKAAVLLATQAEDSSQSTPNMSLASANLVFKKPNG